MPHASILILHFSGTGNSLYLARSLAARIDGAALHPLMRDAGLAAALARADCVGLVFPVHFYQAPPVVLRRLESLDLSGKMAFVLASSGGEAGFTLPQAAQALAGRGARVIAASHLPIADNSVVLKTASAAKEANLTAAAAGLDELARNLCSPNGEAQTGRMSIERWRRLRWQAIAGAMKVGMRLLYRVDRKRIDATVCTGCGRCVTTCQVGAITEADGRIAIGQGCADCFGCLHACPVSAVSFGRIRTTPPTRYVAPLA